MCRNQSSWLTGVCTVIWTSGYALQPLGQWYWNLTTTTTSITDDNWLDGEPNGSSTGEMSIMLYGIDSSYQWVDVTASCNWFGTAQLCYICEVEGFTLP